MRMPAVVPEVPPVQRCEITRTFRLNRECSVDDGRLDETVEWSGVEPSVGAKRTFRVERHLDTVQRVILELRQ